MIFRATFLVAWCASRIHSLAIPDLEQIAFELPDEHSREAAARECSERIAIIGSGITGAVAAFNLYEGFKRQRLPNQWPCITVFERNAIVGGRITETYVFDDPNNPINTCADTFSPLDACIAQAALDVGLTPLPEQLIRPIAGVGVWDGKEIVSIVDSSGFRNSILWSYFKKKRWGERYGDFPQEYDERVLEARLRFDQVLPSLVAVQPLPGAPPIRIPGRRNLSEEVERAELEKLVLPAGCTDEPWPLPQDKRDSDFYDDAIEAGIRERFFTDGLQATNLLENYLSFDEESTILVEGSNLRLVERLLKLSGATVRLETEVQKLSCGTPYEGRPACYLVAVDKQSPIGPYPFFQEFDKVVIATSLDRGNISIFEPDLPDVPGLRQDYEDVVVTHFATPSQLNPNFFNWTDTMPQNILSTQSSLRGGGRDLPFFSLTFLREVPTSYGVENVYKIVSREQISDGEIEQFLLPITNPFREVISWIDHEVLPKSVPVSGVENGEAVCRGILEDIEILPNIYYAGGGEQIIASAEFGCRMGKNAADVIVDDMT